MNNLKRKAVFAAAAAAVIFYLIPAVPAFSQGHGSGQDMQKAREETLVVTEIGRLFSFLVRMDREEEKLKLSRKQAEELYRVAEEIKGYVRFEPSRAEEILVHIEDSILTPAQLLYTDMLFAERDASRIPGSRPAGAQSPGAAGSNSGEGSSSGGGVLSSYLSGGPYNPLLEGARQQGSDFHEFLELVRERSGR